MLKAAGGQGWKVVTDCLTVRLTDDFSISVTEFPRRWNSVPKILNDSTTVTANL